LTVAGGKITRSVLVSGPAIVRAAQPHRRQGLRRCCTAPVTPFLSCPAGLPATWPGQTR